MKRYYVYAEAVDRKNFCGSFGSEGHQYTLDELAELLNLKNLKVVSTMFRGMMDVLVVVGQRKGR